MTNNRTEFSRHRLFDLLLKILGSVRSVLMGILYPMLLLLYCAWILLATLFIHSVEFKKGIVYSWGRVTCWMFGVRVIVHGRENIPSGPCLYLFNHTSFFDIFALTIILPRVYFGAKIELFNIPLFGRVIRQFGMLPIMRENRAEAIRVLKAAEIRFKQGDQFALAPEGGRRAEEKLGPFKSGPFIFAISAQVPIVPVIIKNAAQILPRKHFFPNFGVWTRDLHLFFEKAIPTAGLNVDERRVVQEKVREVMLKYIPAE